MMLQANALRRLELILDEAVTNGDRNQASGSILLEAMKLSNQPQNLVDFYELLKKAEEGARKLKKLPKINRYLQTLEELHQVFVVNHVWNTSWNTFATHIENRGVLIALDALANYFHSHNPAIFLEQEFLENLNSEFESLSGRILDSDLSQELKRFLIEHIEDILKAIRKYDLDGTKELEKATKSLVSDLVMGEYSVKDEDKNNPMYKQVKACVLSLLLYIAPSPYDIIGAVPDINDFWVPKFEELTAGRQKIERLTYETSTIQELIEKASSTFKRQPQKSIAGRELKALSPSKEDVETAADNESDPLASTLSQ